MSLSTTSSRLVRTGSCVPRQAYGRFEFLVCDWSLMKREHGDKITSQTFVMADNSKWILQIFLGGKTERQSGFLTTEVVLVELGDREQDFITATVNLSVLCQKGYHVHDPLLGSTTYKSISATNFRLDDISHQIWAIDNFMQTSELENKYLMNDAILFSLEIEVLGKPVPLNGTMPAYVGIVATLQEDIASILNSAETSFSDIILVVEGKKFNCHRCILAARSGTFKMKFLNPTFSPKLVINRGQYFLSNVHLSVFEDVLRFIYSDECSDDVLAKSSCQLLVAATKLRIPRLITICENYIGETLTPDKVAAMLNLAVELKSDRLDSCCSDFIAAHINNVLATKTLNSLRPQALKNLITRAAIPTSALLVRPDQTENSSFEHPADSIAVHGRSMGTEDEEVKDPMGTSIVVEKPKMAASSEELKNGKAAGEKMEHSGFHYSGDSSIDKQKSKGFTGSTYSDVLRKPLTAIEKLKEKAMQELKGKKMKHETNSPVPV